jgi:hypothetical protein
MNISSVLSLISLVSFTSPAFAAKHFCETVDPRKDPADFKRIIDHASATHGTPTGAIYGIIMNESGELGGDGGNAGGCDAVSRYAIRTRWGRPGEANLRAIQRLSRLHGWDWKKLQASCGRSTMTENKKDFGGCIGPTQVTPAEWIQDPQYGNRDPLNFCWATHYVSKRLKRHHGEVRRKGLSDDAGWEKAIRRYYGRPTHDVSWDYYQRIGRRWLTWHGWHLTGQAEAKAYRYAYCKTRSCESPRKRKTKKSFYANVAR